MIATSTSLYCWDTDKNTTFSTSAQKTVLIKVIDCKNRKAPISSFADQECINLVVVLKSGEIRLYNLYFQQQKIELNKVLLNGDQTITCMESIKKNGRVFFGGISGKVNELQFQDLTNSVFGIISVETKKLVKANLQPDGVIVKLLPSFFKSAPTQVSQLKIDEQRNILYSLKHVTEGLKQGFSIVEVFTLGSLADKFYLTTTIDQRALKEKFDQRAKLNMDETDFTVVQVIPLPFAESATANCVLVLTSGVRVFVEFKTRKINLPSDPQIESKGLQADLQIESEITGDWEILASNKFPNVNLLEDRMLIDSVFSGFHKDHFQKDVYAPNELPEKITHSPFVGFQYTVGMSVYTLGRDRGNYELMKQKGRVQISLTETHSSLRLESGHQKQILSKGRQNQQEEILEITPAFPTGD